MDTLLLLVSLSGWCWSIYCIRALRRMRQCHAALLVGKQDAEALNVSRSRLINYLAHEVRTLVAAVQGGLQVIRMGESKRPVGHWMDLMDGMAVELNALLSAVLDRGQIDCGKLEPKMERVDLQALVGQVVGEFQAVAEARELRLCLLPPRQPVYAMTDPVLLRQVVRNLVSNALKFTRQGGVTLCIRTGLRTRLLAVMVTDSGVGLSPAQLASLFTDYAQPNAPEGVASSGLGLSISRSVARALGGDITVESTLLMGSTFTVWVPSGSADIRSA